jgi:hypothetical protein
MLMCELSQSLVYYWITPAAFELTSLCATPLTQDPTRSSFTDPMLLAGPVHCLAALNWA